MKRLLTLSIVFVAACGSSNDDDLSQERAQLQLALTNTVEAIVVPAIVGFEDETRQMISDADAFCASPSATGLDTLSEQWRTLAESWNHAALYGLGPLERDPIFPLIDSIESMRPNGTDYTNTVRETLEDTMASDETLDQAFFDSLRFNEVGLLALEVLIFERSSDGSTVAADVLEEYESLPRKCDYLIGMAARLQRTAESAEFGWTVSFEAGQPSYAELLIADSFPDGSESVPLLITSVFNQLDFVKTRKLDGILDAQLSGNFYENQLEVLDETERFMSAPGRDYSFFDHMRSRDFGAEVDEVLASLASTRAAAASESRASLRTEWVAYEQYYKGEIPNGLNVVLPQNFNDGD